MPKKRNHPKSFKPSFVASAAYSVSASAEKSSKSVNELLANLRHNPATPSSSLPVSIAAPSVPPAIREILQIPETPPPAPRRPLRQRFDSSGRRLPAGPAPPRSWISATPNEDGELSNRAQRLRISYIDLNRTTLPGSQLPQPGSLIDIILRHLAIEWNIHRVYNQYHLYYVPSHLKPALIRYIGISSDGGVSLSDLKTILLPPRDVLDDEELKNEINSNSEITCLDLSGSIGRSLKLKDVSDILLSAIATELSDELQESWDTADISPTPPRILLPNLTHLSLALNPQSARDISWKQLLALLSKLPLVTHLSLAYWPEPCLTPSARYATISSPEGRKIPYGGTNYYSHSLDHDWSEALLVFRMLSNSLYKLEFLDLTGCASWFNVLQLRDGHDFVDWAGAWGKLTLLRLYTGWEMGPDAMVSDHTAYALAVNTASSVERHIRTMRAGKGRFITVERDTSDS